MKTLDAEKHVHVIYHFICGKQPDLEPSSRERFFKGLRSVRSANDVKQHASGARAVYVPRGGGDECPAYVRARLARRSRRRRYGTLRRDRTCSPR